MDVQPDYVHAGLCSRRECVGGGGDGSSSGDGRTCGRDSTECSGMLFLGEIMTSERKFDDIGG